MQGGQIKLVTKIPLKLVTNKLLLFIPKNYHLTPTR